MKRRQEPKGPHCTRCGSPLTAIMCGYRCTFARCDRVTVTVQDDAGRERRWVVSERRAGR